MGNVFADVMKHCKVSEKEAAKLINEKGGDDMATTVKISVEFLHSHPSSTHAVNRVPCAGEYLVIGEESHEVVDVMHLLDAPVVQAIVRVKG